MKFVIWGAGFRGKLFVDVLGEENVIAFIDRNRKNNYITNKNIISLEEYIKKYKEYIIVISPLYDREIIMELEKCKIFQYLTLNEVPSEMFNKRDFYYLVEKIARRVDKRKKYGIYGINLFSLYIFEFLQKNDCKKVYFIPEDSLSPNRKKALTSRFSYCEMKLLEETEGFLDEIFLTTEIAKNYVIKKIKRCKISNYYDFSDCLSFYYNSRIEKFKNIYKGKRCFIIATGPSLKIEDLSRLKEKKEVCISMNRIYLSFNKTQWRPDYYVISDPNCIKQYENEIKEVSMGTKFVSGTDLSNSFWESGIGEDIYKFHEHLKFDRIKFSEDFSRKAYWGATVTYICIQLAVYMGFKKIYLLGVDHDYSNSGKQHFIDNYMSTPLKVNYYFLDKAYLAAKEYAEEHGIEIYNATRGGKLEIYKRADIDELLNE